LVVQASKTNNNNNPFVSIRLKKRDGYYEHDWDDNGITNDNNSDLDDVNSDNTMSRSRSPSWIFGSGREYSIFESSRKPYRGGSIGDTNEDDDEEDDDLEVGGGGEEEEDEDFLRQMEQYRKRRNYEPSSPLGSRSSTYFPGGRRTSSTSRKRWRRQWEQSQQNRMPQFVQTVREWWMTNVSPNIQSLPKIVCRVEPTTTLKLRKTFRPLKTIIRFGADYNTQIGVWQFKSSWEDAIIGGKLTLAGKELQFTKSWQLSVGAVEDLVTRLRFRAAINLQTFQAYARVGFRTERLTPINVVEGFTVLKRVPLDGARGNVKLEVKANFALPEPEIEYSTETQRSLIGMGDIEVSIDELNLLLDY
jgi:hypothetical protein